LRLAALAILNAVTAMNWMSDPYGEGYPERWALKPSYLTTGIKCAFPLLPGYLESATAHDFPHLDRNFDRFDDRRICSSALGRGIVFRHCCIVQRDWRARWALFRAQDVNLRMALRSVTYFDDTDQRSIRNRDPAA
jgi:hypothetical protein